jgi:hypothetical protein
MRLPGQSNVQSVRVRLGRDIVAVLLVIVGLGFTLGLIAGLLAARYIPFGDAGLLVTLGVSAAIIVPALLWTNRKVNAGALLDRQYLFGAQGERVVAEALDELKQLGYHAFHDIPPERESRDRESLANFDHVVIGAAGVFVIETKTRSKGEGKNEIAVLADSRVLINGREPDRNPITQALALRGDMLAMLQRETGLANIPVRAVVIFPGWYIRDRGYRDAGGEVWTLNENAFAKWLAKEPVRLTSDQIALIISRLDRRARSTDY